MSYQPSQQVLEKYADVLVNFALGGGKGIKPGETVMLIVPELAMPMLSILERVVLKSGGNPLVWILPDNQTIRNRSKIFYENATSEQLAFIPKHLYNGIVEECDHSIFMYVEPDAQALAGIEGSKV